MLCSCLIIQNQPSPASLPALSYCYAYAPVSVRHILAGTAHRLQKPKSPWFYAKPKWSLKVRSLAIAVALEIKAFSTPSAPAKLINQIRYLPLLQEYFEVLVKIISAMRYKH
jgi:hypothetical protein